MATIGDFNRLKVTRCVAGGIFVDCEQYGEVQIPGWDVTDKVEAGDQLDVFLLQDVEGRVMATMRRPLVMPGEAALLKVSSIVASGALLEWGMPKSLCVPVNEQLQPMVKGYSYVVYVHHDRKGQYIIGSTKLEKFLTVTPGNLQLNQEVDLLICDQSEVGYKAVINNVALGVIYNNDAFQALKIGDRIKGFVKNIREDGRVDLYLEKPGYEKIIDISEQILAKIYASGGFIAVTDKSPAEEIYELFGTSKKNYKKAVGGLYKKGLITLGEKGISLVKKAS